MFIKTTKSYSIMRQFLYAFSTIAFMLLICLSCGNQGKDTSGDDNTAKYDTIIHEYPSTAIVIRNAVTDIDGNHYDAVQIGDQVWMAENLRTTRFADGTEIPMDEMWSWDYPYRYLPHLIHKDDSKKMKETIKKWNDEDLPKYGYFYNWPAVMHGASSSDNNPSGVMGICPFGWHVPSDAEWGELEKEIGISNYREMDWRGYQASKIAGETGRNTSDEAGTPGNHNDPNHNSTGFSAHLAGAAWNYKLGDSKYTKKDVYASFWTSTAAEDGAIARHLRYDRAGINREINTKLFGFSVRCIRNKVNEAGVIIKNAVTDIDGNSYDAVQIGKQVWMKNNLRTTRYADGTDIPLGSTYSYTEPYRYIPGANQNNEKIVNQYGYLYNWAAVMHGAKSSWDNPSNVQGICPKGWHIPSDAEWNELESTLTEADVKEHFNFRGDHAGKMAGGEKGVWKESQTAGTPGNYETPERNISSFSILPAGYSSSDNNNSFGEEAWFWSATGDCGDNAYDRCIVYDKVGVVKANRRGTYCGYSVRCVRD